MRSLITFTLLILLALSGLAFQQAQTSPQSYDQLRTQAEKHFGEQSFSLARELYLKAVALDVTPAEKRWTSFAWPIRSGALRQLLRLRTPLPSTRPAQN